MPIIGEQVAQLLVTRAGSPYRGSGYLLTPELALTAWHVVDGADDVVVRCYTAAGVSSERTVREVIRVGEASDIAVVRLEVGREPLRTTAASFGRIGAGQSGIVASAVGFPRWKVRADGGDGAGRVRESAQVMGSARPLSNLIGRGLEVALDAAPAPDPHSDSRKSPWDGMSGAALWIGDRLVGVVSEHFPQEGLKRLTASRLDLALDALTDVQRSALPSDLPFPAQSALLVDATLPATSVLQGLARLAAVRHEAPKTLVDREQQLARVAEFCASEDALLFWQADQWAGKTALMSWIALHPPAGTDVVTFFVSRRHAGQSDSRTFASSMVEQLAALVGEDRGATSDEGNRTGHLLRLYEAASAHAQVSGRRVVILVDGLDEDMSTHSGAAGPSIASLLPRDPLPQVKVLVTSRPHPGLPSDVAADHQLRPCEPEQLPPSAFARDLETVANRLLNDALVVAVHEVGDGGSVGAGM